MLVLTRRQDQKILIADGLIEILVVEISDSKVKIGINAPREISIDREEIFLLKEQSNAASSPETKSETNSEI